MESKFKVGDKVTEENGQGIYFATVVEVIHHLGDIFYKIDFNGRLKILPEHRFIEFISNEPKQLTLF